jgi:glycosyltransferase involved in cell wall biosynthesis
MLTRIAKGLGHTVGVFYSSRQRPAKNPTMREIAFFDTKQAIKPAPVRDFMSDVADQVRCGNGIKPLPVSLSGFVLRQQFATKLPDCNSVFVSRNLFNNARTYFKRTKRFVDLSFDDRPDIMHCTYQLPLHCKAAFNIYTIHDLVPLRLPFASLDNKRNSFNLLRKIAAEADHILTVSEHSRNDIITLLGADADRVTNTYQAVEFPAEYTKLSDDAVADQLDGSFGLDFKGYLLFYGALEPKKNVLRLIEAYLASGVDIPLVLVASGGWENDAEIKLIAMQQQRHKPSGGPEQPLRRQIHRFDYVSVQMLVTLVKGAAALLFPSLYEGFGLPVLEAMSLGTPVLTSNQSSLPEIAGDAAIMVNPYEVLDIARAIKTVASDADLRTELSARGRAQAAKFSVDRYRERMAAFYNGL